MRISDWSSDVCSSDLAPHLAVAAEQVAERDERPDAAGRAAAGADPHARSRVAAAALLAGDDLALARRRLVAGGVDQRQAGDLAACRDVAHLHFHRLALHLGSDVHRPWPVIAGPGGQPPRAEPDRDYRRPTGRA